MKFWIIIQILVKNPPFGWNDRNFGKNRIFGTDIYILEDDRNFGLSFPQKSKFATKIKIFDKNRNFRKHLNFG